MDIKKILKEFLFNSNMGMFIPIGIMLSFIFEEDLKLGDYGYKHILFGLGIAVILNIISVISHK